MDSSATLLAETVQTAHINRHPDPRLDANPSTTSSQRQPMTVQSRTRHHQWKDESVDREDGEEDAPAAVLKPVSQSTAHYPLPDLRFEQSYLHSISGAQTWWKVAWITVWHQVLMPLVQGVLYNLFLFGWQHMNRNTQLHGTSIGVRIRRWWYGVNNWPIPRGPDRKRQEA